MGNGTVHEAGDGCWAYVQRDGSWGWSNAGLVVADGRSLLVDTLFDLVLTAEMLDAFGNHTAGAPIDTVVNTHANGDHCYGNELVADAEIIATTAAAAEMAEVPPALLAGLTSAPGEVGDLFRSFFGAFHFDGITPTLPTRTFEGRLGLDVAGREIELIEVGPAHTRGDLLVHVPDTRTVFTGDILFVEGHPVLWAGPVDNWVAACDQIIAWDVETVVPGHGPITDKTGVQAMKDYLLYIKAEARRRYDAGMPVFQAARDIALDRFAGWGDPERMVVNVASLYREFGAKQELGIMELFAEMGRFHAERKGHGHAH